MDKISNQKAKILRIGIVAGEISGDILGAGLIQSLQKHYPQAQFEGIGGQNMLQAGFKTHYPMETLSVMGLFEVLKHYRTIKRCHDELRDYFLQNPPDIFIGIDAPDFNLRLEKHLKQANISTVHYVSPSVWAWREYRLKHIKQACDLMLTLLPFEAAYYEKKQHPVTFVGHPLADNIELKTDNLAARQALNLDENATWIAILPGSRGTELKQLAEPFIQTAQWLLQKRPDLQFIIPLANQKTTDIFQQHLQQIAPNLPIQCFTAQQSHQVMAAADVILMASGTATLEAMLVKRPMVVAYRLMTLTYWMAKQLVHIPYFSLPNLLANEKLVPEYLQHEVTPENLGQAILYWLDNEAAAKQLDQRFTELHLQLKQSASDRAAQAIVELLAEQ
ncbi:lipid-A-disaccharide synthase [Candidatus Albibeggiatoa sp. nov. BB20]|uniref:lipid-A-disaccharide synthase n=1 Tax=Candidatus Albibeggiatoa sp. nov. BB20 TaxID=3162723 RepID=UPI003365802A